MLESNRRPTAQQFLLVSILYSGHYNVNAFTYFRYKALYLIHLLLERSLQSVMNNTAPTLKIGTEFGIGLLARGQYLCDITIPQIHKTLPTTYYYHLYIPKRYIRISYRIYRYKVSKVDEYNIMFN